MTAKRDEDQRVAPHPTLAGYYGRDEARPEFIRRLFDHSATDYDAIERTIGFGTGRWYRREALKRAGLAAGMRVLDVAIGTGLVAREAIRLTGAPRLVTGLDPSAGMLCEGRRNLGVAAILARGEQLPCRDAAFDFISMGYGLRHLADLAPAFSEFARVLKPGGRLCILELTRPRNRAGYACTRFYLRRVVPFLTRWGTRNAEAALLMRYFWDTIENCVPPERILAALDEAGFAAARRTLVIGLFSEYSARRPDPDAPPEASPREKERSNFFVRHIKR
jgi:demethylmenaquinone methyltransferase/2-methoxy-6-polyprenyl-1,4-benzoquinol methylase